jgi:hypothetical protein
MRLLWIIGHTKRLYATNMLCALKVFKLMKGHLPLNTLGFGFLKISLRIFYI